MSLQTDKRKVQKSNSINTLKKEAKKYGVNIPKNINSIDNFRNKIVNAIEKIQYSSKEAYYSKAGENLTNHDKSIIQKMKDRWTQPRYFKKQVLEGQITKKEADELARLLKREAKYNKKIGSRYIGIDKVTGLGRKFAPFKQNILLMQKLSTFESIMNSPRLSKGAKKTLEALRQGKHFIDVEKDIIEFDISINDFDVLYRPKVQVSGRADEIRNKVKTAYAKADIKKRMKFLADVNEKLEEIYENEADDANISIEEMVEHMSSAVDELIADL